MEDDTKRVSTRVGNGSAQGQFQVDVGETLDVICKVLLTVLNGCP